LIVQAYAFTPLYITQFGTPPWHADGSINPAGVPYGRCADAMVAKHLQVPSFEQCFWHCKLCGTKVNKPPSEAQGAEPVWWWWCEQCRQKKKGKAGAEPGHNTLEAFFRSAC
jgi:hypothetical protein